MNPNELHEAVIAEHALIYGRNVWHYVVYTTVGDFHLVEYEGEGFELISKIFFNDNSKAEKQFKKYCNDLLNGRSL